MGWRGGRWAGRDGPREVRPSGHFALFSPPSVPLARDVSSLEGFKPPFQPWAGPLRSHALLPLQAARAAPFLLAASPAGQASPTGPTASSFSLTSPFRLLPRSRWPRHQAALHVSFQTCRVCWAPHCALLIRRHWPLGLPLRFRPCRPRLPPCNPHPARLAVPSLPLKEPPTLPSLFLTVPLPLSELPPRPHKLQCKSHSSGKVPLRRTLGEEASPDCPVLALPTPLPRPPSRAFPAPPPCSGSLG